MASAGGQVWRIQAAAPRAILSTASLPAAISASPLCLLHGGSVVVLMEQPRAKHKTTTTNRKKPRDKNQKAAAVLTISSWEVTAPGRLLEEPMPTLLCFPRPPSAPQAAEHVPREGFFPSFSLGKLQRGTCRVILVLPLISFWRTLSPLRFSLENYLSHSMAWSSEKKWHCCEQRKAKQRTAVAKQPAILKWDPDPFLLHTRSDLQR